MSGITPIHVWNGITHGSYITIAQKAIPSDLYLRRWVAVYAIFKLKKDPFLTTTLYSFLRNCIEAKYCIVDFEVEVKALEISDGINEHDLINVSFSSAMSDEELIQELENRNIDMSKFVPEWKCNFPL